MCSIQGFDFFAKKNIPGKGIINTNALTQQRQMPYPWANPTKPDNNKEMFIDRLGFSKNKGIY